MRTMSWIFPLFPLQQRLANALSMDLFHRNEMDRSVGTGIMHRADAYQTKDLPMTVDVELACLSDNLSKLVAPPENFSFFYKKLVGLKFPLEVAEILELRDLFNHAIDQLPEPASTDFQHFCRERQADIAALGIEKEHHVERMMRLLAMLRQFHLAHTIESRDTEAYLRKALTNNEKAHAQSVRYGRFSFIGALGGGGLWAVLHQPGLVLQLVTAGLMYLFLDYFYSLTILKRERTLLRNRLEEVLHRRINAMNWSLLAKNIAVILGFARISGVEAFLLPTEQEHEDVYRHYL